TVSDVDEERPTEFVAYLPHVGLVCTYRAGVGWSAERIANPAGRALGVPVTNEPQLRRPRGRSRLTYGMRELKDMSVRENVRMEGNAEFYSSTQISLLGFDSEAFGDGIPESQKFKLAMERLRALTKDSDGDKPALQQLQQASMTPHSDML